MYCSPKPQKLGLACCKHTTWSHPKGRSIFGEVKNCEVQQAFCYYIVPALGQRNKERKKYLSKMLSFLFSCEEQQTFCYCIGQLCSCSRKKQQSTSSQKCSCFFFLVKGPEDFCYSIDHFCPYFRKIKHY